MTGYEQALLGGGVAATAAFLLFGGSELLTRRAERRLLSQGLPIAAILLGLADLALVLGGNYAEAAQPEALRWTAGLILLGMAAVGVLIGAVQVADGHPRSGLRWRAIAGATLAVSISTVAVPEFGSGAEPAWLWLTYVGAAGATTLTTVFGGSWTLARSARSAPSVVRQHIRLVALGLAMYSIVLLLGIVWLALETTTEAWTPVVFWLPQPFIAVALAPPKPIRLLLQHDAREGLSAANRGVLSAQSRPEALDRLLPAIMEFLGARTLVMLDSEHELVWSRGLDDDQRRRLRSGIPPRLVLGNADGPPLVLRLRRGVLAADPHPMAALTGHLDEDRLDTLSVDLELAVLAAERREALADEQAIRLNLERMQAELDASNAALREYGRTIAHDLKTPLTVVRGAAETIAHLESLSSLGEELIASVIEHTDRVTQLIDGQLTAAVHATDREDVQLEELCAWVRETVADELVTTGSTLAWPPGLPTVRFNRGLLERVLLNLVRNALQHATGGGPVTIWVHSPDPDHVLVTDDGAGIPRNARDQIFTEGFRGSQGGSSGLGLSAARAALQRVGADLVLVDSELGIGTTLGIVLRSRSPQAPSSRRPGTPTAESRQDPPPGTETGSP